MKAKISYTVDVDAIPEEVTKLLRLPQQLINEIADESFEITGELTLKTINQIEKIRSKLIIIDTRLSECQSILIGYNDELGREKIDLLKQSEQNSQEMEDANDSY